MMNKKQVAVFYLGVAILAMLLSLGLLAAQTVSVSAWWVQLLISIPALIGFALGAIGALAQIRNIFS
jgi:hypothetical protein